MNEPWPDGWDPHLAAKKGAVWLDETRPGWERLVDLAIFKIEYPCNCVLGQVFADTVGYCGILEQFSCSDNDDWESEHGFDISRPVSSRDAWRALDEAWIDLIRERQS